MRWLRRRRPLHLKVVAVEKGLRGYRSPHDRAAVLGNLLEGVASGTVIEWGINDLRFLLGDLYREHAEVRDRVTRLIEQREAAMLSVPATLEAVEPAPSIRRSLAVLILAAAHRVFHRR